MLNKTQLKAAIKNIIQTGYTNVESAAAAWADVYDNYANGSSSYAQDQSTDRVTTVNKTGLQSGLQSAFTAGSASEAANGIATAVQTYWIGGIFGILFPPILLDPSAVQDISAMVSDPGTGLSSALESIFNVLSDNADAKAEEIATALDNNAKTVKVLCNYWATNPAPPPPLIQKVITLSVD